MTTRDLAGGSLISNYFISKYMLNDKGSFFKSFFMPKRVIIYGRGASGKDTLKDRFRQNGIRCDVSVTTRPMRPGETNGVQYDFVDDSWFDFLVKEDKIKYYVDIKSSTGRWRYGTTKESWDQGGVFIATPDVVNAQSEWLTNKEKKESVFLLLDIPREVSKNRLEERMDNDNSLESRLSFDDAMYGHDNINYNHYSTIIKNHKF